MVRGHLGWLVAGVLVIAAGCGSPPGLPSTPGSSPSAAVFEPPALSVTSAVGVPGAIGSGVAIPRPGALGAADAQPTPARLVIRRSALHLPTPTTRAVAFPTASGLVTAGGLTPSGTTSRVVRIPIDGRPVSTIGRLGHPVHDAAGVQLGGSMIVLGGGASTQDAWVQRVVPGRTGDVVGHLPAARADLAAVVVGSEAIIVGGGASGRADPRR